MKCKCGSVMVCNSALIKERSYEFIYPKGFLSKAIREIGAIFGKKCPSAVKVKISLPIYKCKKCGHEEIKTKKGMSVNETIEAMFTETAKKSLADLRE